MNQHYIVAQKYYKDWSSLLVTKCIQGIIGQKKVILGTNRLKSLIKRLLAGVDILISRFHHTDTNKYKGFYVFSLFI